MFAPNFQNVAVTTDAAPDVQRQRLLAAALARKKMAAGDGSPGRGRQQQQGFAPRNGGQMAAGLGIAVGTLRKALASLEDKGLLERVQGSGNYVRAKADTGSIYAFLRLTA